MASCYERIDPTIWNWVARHSLTLFTSTDGIDDCFRCVYLSSPYGECCQIWIDPVVAASVSFHAAEVESRDDEEMRVDWEVPIRELGAALDSAIVHVHHWFDRGPANAGRRA